MTAGLQEWIHKIEEGAGQKKSGESIALRSGF